MLKNKEKNVPKNINHKFPLPTSSLYMAYINNKYVVVLSNQVSYGVDFDALGKNKNRKRYDDNFLLRYDYDRYANYQTNILIFNDKFRILINSQVNHADTYVIHGTMELDGELMLNP